MTEKTAEIAVGAENFVCRKFCPTKSAKVHGIIFEKHQNCIKNKGMKNLSLSCSEISEEYFLRLDYKFKIFLVL